MKNLTKSWKKRSFYIWVDLDNFIAVNNITIGSYFSTPIEQGKELLPFTQVVDNYNGFESPFLAGIIRNYRVEYNLEMVRRYSFSDYPSRVAALFLLPDEITAINYGLRYLKGSNRILKRVYTIKRYQYSCHDSSWVDFFRLPHMIEQPDWDIMSKAYWTGIETSAYKLVTALNTPWQQEPIQEILFYGTVNFYNRNLEPDIEVDLS